MLIYFVSCCNMCIVVTVIDGIIFHRFTVTLFFLLRPYFPRREKNMMMISKPFANIVVSWNATLKRYKMHRNISIVSLTLPFPAHPKELYNSVRSESLLYFKHWRKFLCLAYAELVWINVLVDSPLPFCRCFHRYLNAGERLFSLSSGPLTLKTASVERQL